MKCVLVGEEKALRSYMRGGELKRLAPKILSLTRLKPKSESTVSMLTPKQRQALVTAFGLGYYELPRKVSSDDLARLLKIDKSTLAEHLRKGRKENYQKRSRRVSYEFLIFLGLNLFQKAT